MKHISLHNLGDKSNFYHIENSVNPIVAAASPIISLLSRTYGLSPNTPEPESWQAICQHELKICVDKCLKLGYQEPSIKAIQIIISSWVNQISIWQFKHDFASYSQALYLELMQDKSDQFHVLELLYILNRLGLPLAEQQQVNELHIQDLFYLIQDTRQTTTNALQRHTQHEQWHYASKHKKTTQKQMLAFLIIGCLACCWGTWQLWLSAISYMQTFLINLQVF